MEAVQWNEEQQIIVVTEQSAIDVSCTCAKLAKMASTLP